MTVSEFEHKLWERTVGTWLEARRPPPEIRPELDLGFRIEGQSIEIFEIRPLWRHPGKKIESSVAKATYVKSRELWKVYWKRADLRWHRYEPAGEMGSLEDVLALVGEDAYGAFWG